MTMNDMKKYLAEMLGTAVLVAIAVGTAIVSGGNLVATALAFGLVIVAMAYAIGPISGCHINPAVSLGVLITKKMNLKDFGFYVLAQVVGAIIGAAILYGVFSLSIFPEAAYKAMGSNAYEHLAGTTAKAIAVGAIVEILLTFLFVFTILGVTSKSENGKIAGFVIGLTLTLVHLIGIGLTGTSVNPARSLTAIFAGGAYLEQLWLFIVAPLLGAALAGLAAWFFFNTKEAPKTQAITARKEK